jgi:hypothetical protein
MNFIISNIQINGNDTVSFLNTGGLVRTMSRILPTSPNFISYRYDTITISESNGESFSFPVYQIELIGTVTYTPLNFTDAPSTVEAKTVSIYNQLTTFVFQACCDCEGGGSGGGGCFSVFSLADGTVAPTGSFTLKNVTNPGSTVFPPGQIAQISISNFTFGSVQDLTNLFPAIPEGSWIFVYNVDDPSNFIILSITAYSASQLPNGFYDCVVIDSSGGFSSYNNKYCIDFSISGEIGSIPKWQQTLDADSTLNKDNFIYADINATHTFSMNELLNINFNATEEFAGGSSAGVGFSNYVRSNGTSDFIRLESYRTNTGPGTGLYVQVGSDEGATPGIIIQTPNAKNAVAQAGDVLVYQGDGTVEYQTITTVGTVTSVGLVMPSAFTVTNSPIIDSGDLTVEGAGDATEYINGLGQLATLPVYTANNGLNNTASPTVIQLGGTLLDDTAISTDGNTLSIEGSAGQSASRPFTVFNLGTAGVANFFAYGNSSSSSVLISNEIANTYAPLTIRNKYDSTGNKSILTLSQESLSDPANSTLSIDMDLSGSSARPSAARLTAGVSSAAAAPNFRSNFSIETVWNSSGPSAALSILSDGKVKFNAYTPGQFSSAYQSLLAVNSSGEVVTTTGSGFIVSITGTAPINVTSGVNPVISMPAATVGQDGFLTSVAYNLFNNKQNPITLTTTGTSGPATFVGSTLNIPQYVGNAVQAGSGLSESSSIISLGQPSQALALSNPLTQDSYIATSGFDFAVLGTKAEEILKVQNTLLNSNLGTGFSAVSDGGNAIVASQNFTGTVTSAYVGKTAGVNSFSNVGFGVYAESRIYSCGYFELYNLVPIDFPALHVKKNTREKTNNYDEVLRIERAGPGDGNSVPGIGFGAVSTYWLRYGSSVANVSKAGSIGFSWISPTTQNSEFIVAPTTAGVENIRLKLKNTGQLQLLSYNSPSAFSGTITSYLAVDAQGNVIQGPGGGGGGGITSGYNGLTTIGGTSIVLGGVLTQVTDINGANFGLNIFNSSASYPALSVSSSDTNFTTIALNVNAIGSAKGINSASVSGTAITGSASDGVALFGVSQNNHGISAISYITSAGNFQSTIPSADLYGPVLSLSRYSANPAVNNMAATIQIGVQDSTGSANIASLLVSRVTDVNALTRQTQFEIQTIQNGTYNLKTTFTAKSTGQIVFNEYTNPSFFNGTVSAYLAVDSQGNVIQTTGGGGGSGITGLSGDVVAFGSGTVVATIQAGVVTYNKIQNVAANSFLANTTGSATSVQEVSTSRIPLFPSAIGGTASTATFLRGDGTWATPTATAGSLSTLTDVNISSLNNGQALIYNGISTKWENQFIVAITELTGDVTTSGTGISTATISNAAVTYGKIQNVAADSFLANATGSAATVQEISTSRIPLFASSIGGTPSTATFLRGDGTWSTPSGASPLTTKGDLYTFDTANTRLPVGTNGQVLVADNTTTTGLRWASTGTGVYTSSNGITLTGSNFGLGGNLDADTTITHTTDSLVFTGEGSTPAGSIVKSLVHVNNTQTATGNSWGLEVLGGTKGSVYFQTDQQFSPGGQVYSLGAQPFIIRSTSTASLAPPIFFETGSRAGLQIKTGLSSNDTQPSLLIDNTQGLSAGAAAYSLNMYTSRSPASTITNINQGRSLINWSARTFNSGVVWNFSQIEGGTEDFNSATRSGSLDFKVLASGGTAPISRMKINPTGQIQFAAYTSLTAFSGTSVASLGVDNLGNIITITGGTGSSPLTTKGDLYTFDTTNARLPVGTNGQVLLADSTATTGLRWSTIGALTDGNKGDITVSGGGTTWTINNSAVTIAKISATGTPSATTFLRGDGQWIAPSGSSPLTTKGDLYTFDTANARLPVGTNGQVLVADNTAATGLRWASTGTGVYTSSNGITLTGSNFTLGGNLDADTTITHTTDSLTFTGEGSTPSGAVAKSLVHINNTQTVGGNSWGLEVLGGSRGCVYFESAQQVSVSTPPLVGTQPFIIRATSGSSNGAPIWLESANRYGVYIKTGTATVNNSPSLTIENAQGLSAGAAAYSLNMFTTRSTVTTVIQGRSLINWSARTNTGILNDFAQIEGGTEDFNNATRSGYLDFKVLASGGTAPISGMKINPTGQIQLAAYTSSSAFTGTSVATLAVDNLGNIITVTGGGSSPLTTKGDLYTYSTTNARLPVGANGEILIADNTTATGLRWGTAPSTGLTSVGLTMPSAFTVANSPLTANGTIAVTGAGNTGQYVRGDGTLANFPSTGGGGGQIFYFNGNTPQPSIGGNAYYELGTAAGTGAAANFTANTTGPIARFITDVNSPNHLIIPSGVWTIDVYLSETGGGSNSAEMVAKLYKYDGSAFTLIATSPLEQITNGSTPDLYTFAISVPNTTTTATDRIAIEFDIQNANGKTVTLYTESDKIGEVHSTYAIGISSLNGLTDNTQTFATGTAGTDFAISSTGSVHTFNLPTASASNRGALSSGDWTTFSNKQEAITGAATTITTSNLTASRVLVSNTSGKVAVSSSLVGHNLATLTDPSQTSYLKINSDNTVSAITAAQLKIDLGIVTNRVVLASNFTTTAGNTYQTVTAFEFPVTSGKTYIFRVTAGMTQTGQGNVSVTGPTASVIRYGFTLANTVDANVRNNQTGYDLPAANKSIINGMVTGEGLIAASANGTVSIRLRSATAGVVTLLAGSIIEWQEVL